MIHRLLFLGLLAPLLFLGLTACGDDPEGGSGELTPERRAELRRIIDEAIVLTEHHKFIEASAAFASALKILPDHPDLITNYAITTMNIASPEVYEKAEAAYDQALKQEPRHLHALHCKGILMRHVGRLEEAVPLFRAVVEQDPHDPHANYFLASALLGLQRREEAREHLERAIEAEPHLSSAIYRLGQEMARSGNTKRRIELFELKKAFDASKTGDLAGTVYTEMGRYGGIVREIHIPREVPRITRAPGEVPSWSVEPGQPGPKGGQRVAPAFSLPAGATLDAARVDQLAAAFGGGLALGDVDGDGDTDFWVATGNSAGQIWINGGMAVFERAPESWALPAKGRSLQGVFGDYDNDGDADLFVACAGPNFLFRNEGDRFVDVTESAGIGGGNHLTTSAVFADLDADSDLDLFVTNLLSLDLEAASEERGFPGAVPGAPDQLFSNDRTGSFTEIAERTGTTGGPSASTCVIASDLDGDTDADLLVTRLDGGPRVYRNDRIWRFVATATTGGLAEVGPSRGGVSADFNGDRLSDLALVREGGAPELLINRGRLRFEASGDETLTDGGIDRLATGDLDGNGSIDLLGTSDRGPSIRLLGTTDPQLILTSMLARLGLSSVRQPAALALADLDFNGSLDVIGTDGPGKPWVLRGALREGINWVAIRLVGTREEEKSRANTGGVGARVEVVCGDHHQVRELTTNPGESPVLHFGLGSAKEISYVRVVWPDDVVQSESSIPVNQVKTITEVQRKSSSCPLLFAWNGERFEFVTDFLGTGGLGFFLEPGRYAPPDPTELVAIPTLKAKDGWWSLRIHEPMEEILYLDEARLLVIDHPEGTEVWPDERLATAAPHPDGRLWVIRSDQARYPVGLETLEGKADPERLRRADRVYQPGIAPDPRFMGYCSPQEITVDFGDALKTADSSKPLVLFLEGWVEYPYAHVNFAAWQAGLKGESLSIDAEMAPGEWKTVLDGFGYPAGMPRMMTVDVSALPRDGTGRLRLRTNLELYVDRLFLAQDLGMDGVEVHDLAAERAILRRTGYPREYSPDGRLPLLYDYALMDHAIDYKTMEGAYTRFGEVGPLLDAADDRYVIMARAEEVALDFRPIPEVAGKRRRFVLKSDGFCKDMDLYTAHPYTVAPLPYHGMPSYPYPPDQGYPATEEMQAWQEEWNTRWLHGSRRAEDR